MAREFVSRFGRYSIYLSATIREWRVLDNDKLEWMVERFPTREDAEMWVLLHS